MSTSVEVISVNTSAAKGTVKTPAPFGELNERGVLGDAHAGNWHRQVSVLSQELIDEFSKTHSRAIKPGEFAENVTLSGIDLRKVAPLDRFRIGEVELEVTQIGKACHGDACAIFREVGACVMPKDGLFCRVVSGGTLRPGDRGVYTPRPFRVRIVTLSDRASAGVYEDRSGPALREILGEFFADTRWHAVVDQALIPDEPAQLEAELAKAGAEDTDVVFTVGSTGVGERDIAPDVVTPLCDKTIPGIMEHIRVTFGAAKPAALLSRSVAGLIGRCQIYTLPGSVRAVKEYAGEILKTLEHTVFMLHGIDSH